LPEKGDYPIHAVLLPLGLIERLTKVGKCETADALIHLFD
jgi:hypothetical protein